MSTTNEQQQREAQEKDRVFKERLMSTAKKIAPFLPPNDDPRKYFQSVALAALEAPSLYDCSTSSIVGAIIKVVQTELTIGQTAFVVPFKDRRRGGYTATFVAHYKGLVQLCYDSGYVGSIDANVVREGETFGIDQGTTPRIVHVTRFGKGTSARGAIVGAYAIATMQNGQQLIAAMEADEIDVLRKEYSAKWKDGALPAWYACKTVLRQLANRKLPMSRRMALAVQYDAGGKLLTWEEAQRVTVPADRVPVHAAPAELPGPMAAGGRMPTPIDAEAEMAARREAIQATARRASAEPDAYEEIERRAVGRAVTTAGAESDRLPWDLPEPG